MDILWPTVACPACTSCAVVCTVRHSQSNFRHVSTLHSDSEMFHRDSDREAAAPESTRPPRSGERVCASMMRGDFRKRPPLPTPPPPLGTRATTRVRGTRHPSHPTALGIRVTRRHSASESPGGTRHPGHPAAFDIRVTRRYSASESLGGTRHPSHWAAFGIRVTGRHSDFESLGGIRHPSRCAALGIRVTGRHSASEWHLASESPGGTRHVRHWRHLASESLGRTVSSRMSRWSASMRRVCANIRHVYGARICVQT